MHDEKHCERDPKVCADHQLVDEGTDAVNFFRPFSRKQCPQKHEVDAHEYPGMKSDEGRHGDR